MWINEKKREPEHSVDSCLGLTFLLLCSVETIKNPNILSQMPWTKLCKFAQSCARQLRRHRRRCSNIRCVCASKTAFAGGPCINYWNATIICTLLFKWIFIVSILLISFFFLLLFLPFCCKFTCVYLTYVWVRVLQFANFSCISIAASDDDRRWYSFNIDSDSRWYRGILRFLILNLRAQQARVYWMWMWMWMEEINAANNANCQWN